MSVCPLSARAEPSGGLRIETPETVAGLAALLTGEDLDQVERPTSLLATVGVLLLGLAVGSVPLWARS